MENILVIPPSNASPRLETILYTIFFLGLMTIMYYTLMLRDKNAALRQANKQLVLENKSASQRASSARREVQKIQEEFFTKIDFLFPDINSTRSINHFLTSSKGTRLRGLNIADAIDWLNFLKQNSKINKNNIFLPLEIHLDASSSRFENHRDENLVSQLQTSKARYVIFMVKFSMKSLDSAKRVNHANAVVIDNTNKTIERFEPHGQCNCEFHVPFEKHFVHFMGTNGINYTYIDPDTICSKSKGPQTLQKELKDTGYCTVWAVMYIHARMHNTILNPIDINANLCKHTPTMLLKNVTNYLHAIDKALNIKTDHRFLPAEQEMIFKQTFEDSDTNELIRAVRNNQIEIVLNHFEQNSDPDQTDRHGYTALMWAAHDSNVQMVRHLIKFRPNPDLASEKGKTALMIAVSSGKVEIVREIIKLRPNPDLVAEKGNTALMLAVSNDYVDIVRELVDLRPNPDLADSKNVTGLICAAWKGNVEIVRELIKLRPNLAHATDFGTALKYAKWYNNAKVVKLLEDTESRQFYESQHSKTS